LTVGLNYVNLEAGNDLTKKDNDMDKTKVLSLNGMEVRTTKKLGPVRYSQIFYVTSQSDPEKEYVVTTRLTLPFTYGTDNNEYLCSCPDFHFREWPQRKVCKHIGTIKVLVDLFGAPSLLAAFFDLVGGPIGPPQSLRR